MIETKPAPNLPDRMVEHVNRCLSTGGTDGHMYKMLNRSIAFPGE